MKMMKIVPLSLLLVEGFWMEKIGLSQWRIIGYIHFGNLYGKGTPGGQIGGSGNASIFVNKREAR